MTAASLEIITAVLQSRATAVAQQQTLRVAVSQFLRTFPYTSAESESMNKKPAIKGTPIVYYYTPLF